MWLLTKCARAADARGVRVTGTEIVGLVPKRTLIDAGKYFLRKQHRSVGIPDSEIIRIAIKSMGLDQLGEFDPKQKVIEYLIEDKNAKRLVDLTARGFAEETASESPAPAAALSPPIWAHSRPALGTMVANLSAHKAAYGDRWEEFSNAAECGQDLMERLLHLVDEDTEAFNRIMDVFGMPKKTDAEKAARAKAMEEATLYATEVSLAHNADSLRDIQPRAQHGRKRQPRLCHRCRRRRPCSKSCSARSIP